MRNLFVSRGGGARGDGRGASSGCERGGGSTIAFKAVAARTLVMMSRITSLPSGFTSSSIKTVRL